MFDIVEKIRYYSDVVELPEEAKEFFAGAFERLDRNGRFSKAVFDYGDGRIDYETLSENIKAVAEEENTDVKIAYGTLILSLCEIAKKRYEKAGYDDQLFKNTFDDIRYKTTRLYYTNGIYGTSLIKWYKKFFELGRFGIGRLQFEKSVYKGPETSISGIKISPGDGLINMHIPRSGAPLSEELVSDAFSRAYPFFGGKDGSKLLFGCYSWLLYPPNAEMLGQKSNITKFLKNFRIVSVTEHPFDPDDSGLYADRRIKTPEEIPETSTLQRAYKKRLLEGRLIGEGRGIFLFDGKNVITD